MRIAILGAGFAGLAVTWYLLHYTKGSSTIDLYDPKPIGEGTSGLSSGLFHPYVGKQAKPSWQSAQGLKETHRLITEASQAIGKSVILAKGIVRPALSTQQITDFHKTASCHPDTEWWEKKRCEREIPGLALPAEGGGLYIREGLTLDTSLYLQGLWQACARLGTQYHAQELIQQEMLSTYDRVLVAMGTSSNRFSFLQTLPYQPVKGHILTLEWPKQIPPLPYSLIAQKYIVMSPDQQSCLVGATFEHEFTSPDPDLNYAQSAILPHITTFFPPLEGSKILACRSGVRASATKHLPIVGKYSDKIFFFTGLGSKGLLYHAWVGKCVARALLTNDTQYLPAELHYVVPRKEGAPK